MAATAALRLPEGKVFVMLKRLWLTCVTLGTFGFLTLGLVPTPPVTAAEKSTDERSEKQVKEDGEKVKALGMAYELVDMGREKKSPEMLIAAARILRTTRTTPGKEKTEIKEGKDEKSDKDEVDLKEESDKLLKEAVALDKGAKPLADGVAKLGRGSLGGPRSYFHRPGAGTVISLGVSFRGGQPANISVTGNGRNSLTLTATAPNGHFLTWTGLNPSLNWVPVNTHGWTITVTNNGPGAAAYTLYHN